MKIIAFYLPQFHTIPENDQWWGKGFTEWTNVKKARPLYPGHNQPRIPLDGNYYCLLDDNKTLSRQCQMAKEYGIYGFCFYHYWFSGKKLLEKPVENFLRDRTLNMPFCLCWANEHWTNAWVSNKDKILIEQKYGNRNEWEEHYQYFKPFFSDERYIKNGNKPLLVIYRPEIIPCIKEMMAFFRERAITDGFAGIEFAYQSLAYDLKDYREGLFFDYDIEYQPLYARTFMKSKIPGLFRHAFRCLKSFSYKYKMNIGNPDLLKKYNYRDIWNYILNTPPVSGNSVPCGFVDWDNTPRREKGGSVIEGYDSKLFQEYMTKLIQKTKDVYHRDFMFFFAWNEWAEGGYLEPDTKYGYEKLSAIRQALKDTGEYYTGEKIYQ